MRDLSGKLGVFYFVVSIRTRIGKVPRFQELFRLISSSLYTPSSYYLRISLNLNDITSIIHTLIRYLSINPVYI